MRFVLPWIVGLGVASLACGSNGDDGAADSDTSDGGGSVTGSTGAATSAGDHPTTDEGGPESSGGSEAGDDGASESTTATGGGSSESGGSGGGDESGGDSCAPAPDDDACRACVKPNCCELWLNCYADAICGCTLDCVLEGNSPGSCKNPCGGENMLYQGVFFCGQMYCLGQCDWSCCS